MEMLLTVVIVLVVVGMLLALMKLVPIDARFKQAIVIIVVGVMFIWLLIQAVAFLPSLR